MVRYGLLVMKKILFIYRTKIGKTIPEKKQHMVGWADDCNNQYKTKFWGYGFNNDVSINALKKEIDIFKPDFIYMTMRSRYTNWLHDLTSIRVPKIFVEVDSYKYDRSDSWYDQFDKVYCRQAWWKPVFYSREKIVHPKYIKNSITWNNVPVFKWSVPEKAFPRKIYNRNGIYFFGAVKRNGYTDRKMMYDRFKGTIICGKIFGEKYWNSLHMASALVCPTESNYGSFVPSKLFEFLASGAAVITNCDLDLYGSPELKDLIIPYTDLDNLKDKLKTKFSKFYNKAVPAMRGHTHRVRYKELFG